MAKHGKITGSGTALPLAAAIPFLAMFALYLDVLDAYNYSLFKPSALSFGAVLLVVGAIAALLIRKTPKVIGGLVVALFVIMFVDFQLFQSGNLQPWNFFLHPLLVALVAFLVQKGGKKATYPLFFFFAVVLASTIILIPFGREGEDPPASQDAILEPGNPGLPVLVHLVLDEHTGLAGKEVFGPEADGIVNEAVRTYSANGFDLYPGAYSQYSHTVMSLWHMFNFKPTVDREWLSQNTILSGARLETNKYFSWLLNQGYRLTVYENYFLRLCLNNHSGTVQCKPYRRRDLNLLDKYAVPFYERLVFIADLYMRNINYMVWSNKLMLAHEVNTRESAPPSDFPASEVRGLKYAGNALPNILPSLNAFEGFEADLRNARPGQAFFIHLLAPHYPHLVGPDCKLLPSSEWVMHRYSGNFFFANTEAERKERYQGYFQQLGCTTTIVARVISVLKEAGLYENAVIIIHGDHGARIAVRDTLISQQENLTPQDFRDAYDTLFAVKLPNSNGGLHEGAFAIQALFQALVENGFQSPPDLAPGSDRGTVYLRNPDQTEFLAVKYPPEEPPDSP